MSEYLLWGFALDKLCEFVVLKDTDGNLQYEKFVIRIMDAKLHLKNKNCADPLKIDQDGDTIHPSLEDSLGRYYSLMRVNVGEDSLAAMATALMINDDLYLYSGVLADKHCFSG